MELAERVTVVFWCHRRHQTALAFATDDTVVVPLTTACRRCGGPAGVDAEHPPVPSLPRPFKTHLAYVRERRSQAEGDALVDAAVAALRPPRPIGRTKPLTDR